jgi:hypothetical protein
VPPKSATSATKHPAKRAPQSTAKGSEESPAKSPTKPAAVRPSMGDDQRKAIAQGRSEAAAVRAYLEALSAPRRRGRRRTKESIERRLGVIDASIGEADVLTKVMLIQERLDLTAERDRLGGPVPMGDLEAAFIAAAPGFSSRKGISKAAWREVGVSSSVLKRAGI